MNQQRPTRASISRAALVNNLNILRAKCSNPFFCPMIKANAYGHGAVDVARCLEDEGVRVFGVATLEEALSLRKAGITRSEILIFSPIYASAPELMQEHKLTPVIYMPHDLSHLKNASKRPVVAHVKFNTGMNRLGFHPSQVDFIKKETKSLGIEIAGVCTHLARGSDIANENSSSQMQLKIFSEVVNLFSKDVARHALNSDAILAASGSVADFGARPGIALYGYSDISNSFKLIPVLDFQSKIIEIHRVSKGTGVSYGPTWTANRSSRIGVIPAGYADGVRRSLSNKINIRVGHTLCPSVGTICMDYFLVDLTDIDADESEIFKMNVTIFGKDALTALDWAKSIGTISYEILTGISTRVPRELVA